MRHNLSVVRIKAVYNALGPLQQKVVFVGGAVVQLYADRMTDEVRPTDDVDIIVEIVTYHEYSLLEEQLRKMGFTNDIYSKVICRYQINGIIVDIMPTGKNVLDFKSDWYPDGFKNSVDYKIDERTIIRILKVEYFIASKIEAFKDRGNNDGRTSTDFEDIIYVFENRKSVWTDMNSSSKRVKKYLIEQLSILIVNKYFEEWVGAHANFGNPPATYYILEQLKLFCNQKS